jgi:hypothetical protein
MEFFSGFKWAVPIAFSDAVSLCRFAEGDILYDTPKAYDDEWGTASKHIEYSLQVRYPTSATGGASANESGIFASNWCSEVRVELYKNLEKVEVGQSKQLKVSFTALWKGDVTILKRDTETPQLPMTVQEVTHFLGETSETAKKLSVKYPVFVMARDLSNAISKDKYSKILSKLKRQLAGEPQLLHPQSAGLHDWATIAPTIDIAFFKTNGVTTGEVHDMVKEAVYVRQRRQERYVRISAHGVIF